MVNIIINLATLSGFAFVVVAISLFVLGIAQPRKLVQNVLLGITYLLAGLIFFVYGWRFDLIMQLGLVLLTGASIYWVINEYRRTRP